MSRRVAQPRALLFTVIAIVLTSQSNLAYSMGDTYTRIAETAKVITRGVIPDCSGQLLESFFEEGNMSIGLRDWAHQF
jgi:hypothetical protein